MTSPMIEAASAYSEAYRAVHGAAPHIAFSAGRATVTTKAGTCAGYTAKDLNNLARALARMAK